MVEGVSILENISVASRKIKYLFDRLLVSRSTSSDIIIPMYASSSLRKKVLCKARFLASGSLRYSENNSHETHNRKRVSCQNEYIRRLGKFYMKQKISLDIRFAV